MSYNHGQIEKKWQQYWKDNKTYKMVNDESKPKFYALDMFPYPSGAGLHVGHPLGYIATDILSSFKRKQGYNVLHPMGWDAFGLPAEQYAIDTGNDPAEFTAKNIATFKRQMNDLGFSYDWDREVNTTDPKYYKWTRIFSIPAPLTSKTRLISVERVVPSAKTSLSPCLSPASVPESDRSQTFPRNPACGVTRA